MATARLYARGRHNDGSPSSLRMNFSSRLKPPAMPSRWTCSLKDEQPDSIDLPALAWKGPASGGLDSGKGRKNGEIQEKKPLLMMIVLLRSHQLTMINS
ncbi:hypothetical protein JZ751_003984 [Albula glossodonta]|uniref:Uncharacterized protein n=1 Tax=Albula glossodonta TaxID=121402 RepID=A0A8T2P5X0_9TELE|nr:hypothetical protein JZ751_003984 [Albula glossodonta]